ncbi:MAG: fructosamine kinase family protein [Candidatus Thioglobus sp.]|nr:fructosamine kinase family protein [Candidatus Thioglobus sp.]
MSVEFHIQKHLGKAVASKQSVGSGLFSAYQIQLKNGGKVFIKYQKTASQQLINEGKSLTLLGKTIHTPKVLGACEFCLILEWISPNNNPNLQAQAGAELALLHQNTAPFFGFDFDNNIGTTPQKNAPDKQIESWKKFYWQYRLLFQIQLAYQNNHLNEGEYQRLLSVENQLEKLLADGIQPSLLHGDLWSGNLLSGKAHPYFIDCACYYGHREIDLALTFMFGGFSNDFYHNYNKIYPLETGFERRKPLYMLYHYLNHLNIFGGSYHANVLDCYEQINSI